MDIKQEVIGEVPQFKYVRITVYNDTANSQCFYDAGGNLVEVKPGESKSFVVIRKGGVDEPQEKRLLLEKDDEPVKKEGSYGDRQGLPKNENPKGARRTSS